MGGRETERANASSSAHGVGHLLVAAQRLDAQSDRLQLCAHLDKLLDISACADQVLRHDLASILGIALLEKTRGRTKDGSAGGRERHTSCPALALFLMSAMSFFSLCSSFVRSRSSSRCALARER
jgi:hypothetical protein